MDMKKLFVFTLILCLCAACAQFATPTGGDDDEDPPYLIPEKSDKNFQTNFSEKSFQLTFNEWITVNNPTQQVVVSPPTVNPLQVSYRGKTVRVKFSELENLKENVTYQVNFGDAIRDFTEGNIYKNLVFVFSTGDEIDSLSVNGNVTDAMTGEPVGDVIVCLYDNLSDSCFLAEKPFYFTKTDKSGRYKLSNIRADTFQIYALKDDNVNYYYDQISEWVGFNNSFITLKDSSLINIDLKVFDEENPGRIVDVKQDRRGLIKVIVDPVAYRFNATPLTPDSIHIYTEQLNDTLIIWHNHSSSDSVRIKLEYNDLIDTITGPKSKKTMVEFPFKLARDQKSELSFLPKDYLQINFNKVVSSVDSSKVVMEDSLSQYDIKDLTFTGREIDISFDSLDALAEYSLTLYPGAIRDIFGVENLDTIVLPCKTLDPKKYGSIKLNFINSSDTQYIARFYSGKEILEKSIIDSTQSVTFERMAKGTYKLDIVEDLDRNGRWSSGSVISKRLPEQIKEVTLDELKAGWDLELDIIIKDIFNGTEVK